MRPLQSLPVVLVPLVLIVLVLGQVAGSCAPSHSGSAPNVSAFVGQQAPIPPSAVQISLAAPTGLAYADNPAIYSAGRTIPTNAATVGGAGPFTFHVVPSLPGGLHLDAATGNIDGTPRAETPTARYVVTASNASGSTRVALFITVLAFNQEIEPSHGGDAASLHITGLWWGNLVDVYDLDPDTGRSELRARDLVIGDDVTSGGLLEIHKNLVTQTVELTIRARFGSDAFRQAYDQLESNLVVIQDKDLNGLPPWSLVPRNAAVVVRFDDLLDASTVSASTLRLLTGYPPVAPFEARIFADRNHGGTADRNHDGLLEFESTRVVLDLTVSEVEASGSNPPLAVNLVGLPASTTQNAPDGVLRIPTQIDPPSGQLALLRNLSGNAVAFSGNGSNDPTTPTHDVIRAFRSGGDTAQTGDPNNGFVHDGAQPRVVGRQAGTLTSITPDPGLGSIGFALDFAFASSACARSAARRDVLQVADSYLEVCAISGPPAGAQLSGVRARLVHGPIPSIGPAELFHAFDPALDAGRSACFVMVTPAPGVPPAQSVDPQARFSVLFSEPMRSPSIDPFETFPLLRTSGAPVYSDFVVADILHAADLREFTLVPSLPLRHATGQAEHYFLSVHGGTHGATDLSGNPLLNALPQTDFSLDPTANSANTFGFALRMNSNNMIPDAGNKPELRGQFLLDFDLGQIKPRPVTHFEGIADRTRPVPANMVPLATGTQTPLSGYGSKLQSMWRYCDVGFALFDEQNVNVDVEGLAWAPVGGAVIADHFTRFEMSLCHALHLPDESTNPVSLLPLYPNSGVVTTYAQNVLDPANDPLRTVYPVAQGPHGYTVNPADRFVSQTGTVMLPWPLNRNVPVSQFSFYTWRDTALQARGAPADSPGVDLPIIGFVNGTPGSPPITYPTGQVPTIGLALLAEFRCYPDTSALSLNALDISIAVASSSRPNFRAFSTGGINSSGQAVIKDPDLELVASGGFNPGSNPPGAPTLPVDDTFHIGQMDLVVRVSRVHSIWFDTAVAATTYAVPVVIPAASDLPAGTRVDLAYRGATSVANIQLLTDATRLDAYGDRAPGNPGADPAFLNNDPTWKANLPVLNGAKFFQTRITFVSNTETGLSPWLDALGFAWSAP